MPEFYNRTRRSESIPRKLLRRGRVLELPLYYLVRASDLAHEGIENSGSYRFADHIYRSLPSGRGALGRWLDRRILGMPAVRSFRNRFIGARDELTRFLAERTSGGDPLVVLSVPCGIPRELTEAARLHRAAGGSLGHVTFHGLDLSPDVLQEASTFALCEGLPSFVAHCGDALARSAYPEGADFITCTGLGEFLNDEQLVTLYGIFYEVLAPGGILYTSAMRRVAVSDYLLRLAELRVHYRSPADLEAAARRLPFSDVRVRPDALGIQSLMVARK